MKRFSFSSKKILRYAMTFFIACLIEFLFFNWGAFLTAGNKPIDRTGSLSYGPAFTNNGDGSLHISENAGEENADDPYFEILDIGFPVNYIRIDIEVLPDNGGNAAETIDLVISCTDAGNSYYMPYPQRTVLHKLTKSQFIHLNASGNVGQIRISLSDLAGKNIRIHSVVLNPVRPFMIAPERILLLTLLLCLLWELRPSSRLWRFRFRPGSQKQRAVVVLCAAVQIAAIVITMESVKYPDIIDSPYTKLADSIIAGTPYLADMPSQELMDLSNPYDTSLRAANQVHFMWDYAYFEGHYYVYFGVIPALLLHVPYRLLTGEALTNYLDILLPGILCAIGIYYLIWQLCKRYFRGAPFLLFVLLSVTAANSCHMMYLCAHPDFYSIPKLWSLMFTVWGLGLWLAAPGKEETPRCFYLAAGSLCMAAVAGCRPQMLLGSFLAVPLFWDVLAPFQKNRMQKGYTRRLFCFFAPFLVLAAGLMYYNYIRFGSPFDFGANYNLTTNDMTQRGLRIGRIPAGFFSYLFQHTVNILRFPFLSKAALADTFFQGTNIFTDTFGGIFFRSLFLWAAFLVFKGKPLLQNRSLQIFGLISFLSAFVITAVDTMMAGVQESYISDFSIFFILTAIVMLISLGRHFEGQKYQSASRLTLTCLCLQSLVFHFFFMFASSSIQNNSPLLFYKVYYFLQFWL